MSLHRCHRFGITCLTAGLVLAVVAGFIFQTWGQSDDRVPMPTESSAGNAVKPETATVLSRQFPSAGSGPMSIQDLRGAKATVLVFLSTECPISNGYLSTINRLASDYQPKGVNVVGINSNEGCSLRDMASHKKEFAISFPVLKDAGAIVADELKATHCPEALILDDLGKIRYRGRIDDRYAKRGGAAGDVQRQDLLIALQEVLDGKPVTVETTKVTGCPIARPAVKQQPSGSAVTYSEHVAPLLQVHCENCHRPGGIGPFSLQTYEQAALWADDIREFTANRQMPPWLPDDEAGDFHNRRVMPDAAIELIRQWVEGIERDPGWKQDLQKETAASCLLRVSFRTTGPLGRLT